MEPKTIWIATLVLALMSGEWILFVAGTKAHEMMVGAACVLLSAAFLLLVQKSSGLRLSFRLADLAACWRIPWYVVSDACTITIVLFQDIFGSARTRSPYRVLHFHSSKHGPVTLGRQVLAVAYTSATPNTIVLGVDYKQDRMLLHQLKRSGPSAMLKDLGGRP